LIKLVLVGDVRAVRVARAELAVVLNIDLVDTTEPAEFALEPVEVAVVIAVRRGESRATPDVLYRHAFNHVNRKWKAGHPGRPGTFIEQIELGRRRVLYLGLATKVVARPDQQVGLLAAHQVDIADLAPGAARQRRRPNQAGSAIAQEIHGCDLGEAVH